jgi:hypothetical protein
MKFLDRVTQRRRELPGPTRSRAHGIAHRSVVVVSENIDPTKPAPPDEIEEIRHQVA